MTNEFDDEMGFDDEEMTVTLDLEDGPVTCAVIVILTVDEKDYIVLLPLDENGDNEEGNVWIYRYVITSYSIHYTKLYDLFVAVHKVVLFPG